MRNKKITCKQFWQLPQIIEAQNIQKQNAYNTKAHKDAENKMIKICTQYMGADFALSYFGEY